MAGVRASGPFPALALPDLEGVPRSLAEAWADGEALVLVGLRDCRTTRDTLPLLDRIDRRRGTGTTVLLVLQDDVEAARGLVADLGLGLPVRLDLDPYRLAQAVGLAVVPTLFLIEAGGAITRVSEGLRRSDLEALAQSVGVTGPLWAPEDEVPPLRPG